MELAPESVFNGSVTAAASDYFKFAAKKGDRILFECASREIDSRLSPVLAVLDAGGREIESIRRGGLLDFRCDQIHSFHLSYAERAPATADEKNDKRAFR